MRPAPTALVNPDPRLQILTDRIAGPSVQGPVAGILRDVAAKHHLATIRSKCAVSFQASAERLMRRAAQPVQAAEWPVLRFLCGLGKVESFSLILSEHIFSN
jgi:hypothetical protein